MTKAEFDLEAALLVHYRNKTRIAGSFWLPPELIAILRVEFAKHPAKPLALYSEEGNPLVWFKAGKLACDSVRLFWDRLRIKAEVPDALSFKFLRKYAGDWTTRHGGEAMGMIALSHARTTVLAKNYSTARDFETFNELQRKMHAELKAAGMFDPAETKKAQKKNSKVKKGRKG